MIITSLLTLFFFYRFQSPRRSRDEAVLSTLHSWQQRLDHKRKNPNSADRLGNPLTATHSAPGGGKSSILDLLASLIGTSKIRHFTQELPIKSEEERMGVENLANILSTSVPILITYGSNTPFLLKIDGPNPEHGLVLRVLFSFFFDHASSFSNFASAFGNATISLEDALTCLTKTLPVGTRIFLGLDELIKAARPPGEIGGGSIDRVSVVLSAVGSASTCLRNSMHLLPLSIRVQFLGGINWVELCRPTFLEACSLLPPQSSPLLLRCVSDCNGHLSLCTSPGRTVGSTWWSQLMASW